MAFQIIRSIEGIIWLVLCINYPPAGDEANVGDIGGCGHDDGDRVDKWQEEFFSTTVHLINNDENRKKHSHGGEDKPNCDAGKYPMAVLEQPQSVQDVADEVEQGKCQLCDKSL